MQYEIVSLELPPKLNFDWAVRGVKWPRPAIPSATSALSPKSSNRVGHPRILEVRLLPFREILVARPV